ncbi:putative [histone H3]-lysine(4) N-trimethyltransferase [Helianthus debilis subsp. tardiflorus]
MTLISAATCSKTLVICPDKRSNIARFINGINNHTPGEREQNLKCVRFNVDGEATIYQKEKDCIMTTMHMKMRILLSILYDLTTVFS